MSAQVIPFSPRRGGLAPAVAALIHLARLRKAWNEQHPQATLEQQLEAHARIAKELGL